MTSPTHNTNQFLVNMSQKKVPMYRSLNEALTDSSKKIKKIKQKRSQQKERNPLSWSHSKKESNSISVYVCPPHIKSTKNYLACTYEKRIHMCCPLMLMLNMSLYIYKMSSYRFYCHSKKTNNFTQKLYEEKKSLK